MRDVFGEQGDECVNPNCYPFLKICAVEDYGHFETYITKCYWCGSMPELYEDEAEEFWGASGAFIPLKSYLLQVSDE